MAYTRENKKVIREIIAGARRAGFKGRAYRKARNTGLAVGFTESRYTNPSGGDRDSAGWRQERAMYYKNPTNLRASVDRFYREYKADANPNSSLGARAQAVQQSGTPHVWDDKKPLVKSIARRFDNGNVAGGGGRGGQSSGRLTRARFKAGTPSGFDAKSAVLARHAAERGSGVGGSLKRAAAGGLGHEAADPNSPYRTPGTRATMTPGKYIPGGRRGGGSGGGRGAERARAYIRRGDAKDRQHLDYKWGGGHGPRAAALKDAVDCSGYVRFITRTGPMVSGQYAKWGKPGKGKHATVYANDHHVLMSVKNPDNGKTIWYATSRSNPGGGAGRIDPPSASYLSGFTARHPG